MDRKEFIVNACIFLFSGISIGIIGACRAGRYINSKIENDKIVVAKSEYSDK